MDSRLRTGAILSILTAIQLVSSFAAQWYVVSRLGAGSATDSLFAGMTITQLVLSIGVETLAFVLIPLLASQPEPELRSSGWRVFLTILFLSSMAAGILYLIVPWIVPVLTPGFSPEVSRQTAFLARIQLGCIVGSACTTVLVSIHQARQRFIPVPLSMIIGTAVGWLIMWRQLSQGGVEVAAWAQVVIAGVPALLLCPILGRLDLSHRAPDLFKQIGRRLAPLAAGAGCFRTGYLVDRFLLSFLPAGHIALLDLAQRSIAALVRILNQSLVTPILPVMSQLATQRRWKDFLIIIRRQFFWITASSVLLIALISILPLLASNLPAMVPTSQITGSLASHNLRLGWILLLCLSGVLLFGAAVHLLSSSFFAMGDTRRPSILGIFAYGIGLMIKIGGFLAFGVIGVALATTTFYALHWIFLRTSLRRRMRALVHSDAKMDGSGEPGGTTAEINVEGFLEQP